MPIPGLLIYPDYVQLKFDRFYAESAFWVILEFLFQFNVIIDKCENGTRSSHYSGDVECRSFVDAWNMKMFSNSCFWSASRPILACRIGAINKSSDWRFSFNKFSKINDRWVKILFAVPFSMFGSFLSVFIFPTFYSFYQYCFFFFIFNSFFVFPFSIRFCFLFFQLFLFFLFFDAFVSKFYTLKGHAMQQSLLMFGTFWILVKFRRTRYRLHAVHNFVHLSDLLYINSMKLSYDILHDFHFNCTFLGIYWKLVGYEKKDILSKSNF